MAKMIHDSDVNLAAILGRRVAVMGYGSLGHAHALNLTDSGADVRVGGRPGSRGGTGSGGGWRDCIGAGVGGGWRDCIGAGVGGAIAGSMSEGAQVDCSACRA